jgi:hypothetical protein
LSVWGAKLAFTRRWKLPEKKLASFLGVEDRFVALAIEPRKTGVARLSQFSPHQYLFMLASASFRFLFPASSL